MPTKLHPEGASAVLPSLAIEIAPAAPLPQLVHAPGTITLAYTTDVAATARAAHAYLSEEEHARAGGMLHAERREEFLAGRCLLRTLLQSARPAHAWRVVEGPHGRPELEGGDFSFSITHTRGLVACALGERGAIGVDVEDARRKADWQALSRRFFTAAEAAALAQEPSAPSDFFRLWTLKEACLKATGTGLHAPLESFAFTPHQSGWQLVAGMNFESWRLAQIEIAARYWTAVAWSGPPPAPALRVVPAFAVEG